MQKLKAKVPHQVQIVEIPELNPTEIESKSDTICVFVNIRFLLLLEILRFQKIT